MSFYKYIPDEESKKKSSFLTGEEKVKSGNVSLSGFYLLGGEGKILPQTQYLPPQNFNENLLKMYIQYRIITCTCMCMDAHTTLSTCTCTV